MTTIVKKQEDNIEESHEIPIPEDKLIEIVSQEPGKQ